MDLARLAAGALYRPDPARAPVRFAATELRAYLARLFGDAPDECTVAGATGAWLHLAPRHEEPPLEIPAPRAGAEYALVPRAGGLTLTAATPRALVAAVYALLEAAGCEWSPDGPDGERLPREPVRTVPALEGRPAFTRRTYASDLGTWHYGVPSRLAERLPSDVAFIDWMAKSGATGFLFIRAANDTQWTVPQLAAELGRRGLALEVGGHVLTELLPRSLFAAHPEYFPLTTGGDRSDFGNLCPSSHALAVVTERARAAFAGAADVHLWGLDALGGGWCACERCGKLTPSDQALLVCNAVADALARDVRVFHLAYHDTLAPPESVRPAPGVSAEFAPRERCYAHALDDPACTTNRPYREAFERHLERFAGRVHVFEYYGDAILFGGCAVPLVDVCGRDLEYYRRAGARGVSCLTFGRYSLWAHGANIEAFARASIRPAGAPAARMAHCTRRFGAAAAPMARYLSALEALMARVVTYGDVKLPPVRDAIRAALDEALAAAPDLRGLLRDAAAGDAASAQVAAEEQLLDYTLATLAAVRGWVAAAVGEPGEADAERAAAALGDAIRHLAPVPVEVKGSWGAYDLEVANAFYAATLRSRLLTAR